MPFGYHGRYLRIDLTRRKSEQVEIDESLYRRFIGGGGLGTALLLQESEPGMDPLGEAAPLLYVFSPLVGSPLTTSAKFTVIGKSPLTQRINDSLSSSHFAIAGKKTGFDAICITGQSTSPVTLRILNDEVEFLPASDVWGLSSQQTADVIRGRIGRQYRVTAIGPAGENLVRFATISNDGRHAGRGGLGAVMGSKRLKAIAVHGDRLTEFAQPDELIRYAKELSQLSFGPATAKYRELGTVSNLLTFNRIGSLPTRNFQESSFAEVASIAPTALADERTRESCAACTIGCEHIFKSSTGSHAPVRMEYENLYALGPLCGISDPETVLAAAAYCDEVGIDTISAGVCVAFAMECAEQGLIDRRGLRFGNGPALLQLLKEISEGQGLGGLLSLGVRESANRVGQGAEQFAMHVKGLELPGYEPRALQTMALGFAVGTRGADHNRSGAYQVDFSEGTNRLHPDDHAVAGAVETENEAALMDSMILCKFLRGVFDDKLAAMAQMLELVTGWSGDVHSIHACAERIVTAKKLFNIAQGWIPEEDTLPERFFTTQLSGNASAGAVLDRERLQSQIRRYNYLRGWTAEGVPTAETIERLELTDFTS